jgi:hypothetical protein
VFQEIQNPPCHNLTGRVSIYMIDCILDMIRAFEKEILNDIHFAERFINAINACVRDNNTFYKLLKKDVKGALSKSEYPH